MMIRTKTSNFGDFEGIIAKDTLMSGDNYECSYNVILVFDELLRRINTESNLFIPDYKKLGILELYYREG